MKFWTNASKSACLFSLHLDIARRLNRPTVSDEFCELCDFNNFATNGRTKVLVVRPSSSKPTLSIQGISCNVLLQLLRFRNELQRELSVIQIQFIIDAIISKTMLPMKVRAKMKCFLFKKFWSNVLNKHLWIISLQNTKLSFCPSQVYEIDIPQDYIDLLESCWSSFPKARPKFDRIVFQIDLFNEKKWVHVLL